jgi:hypothetical protein
MIEGHDVRILYILFFLCNFCCFITVLYGRGWGRGYGGYGGFGGGRFGGFRGFGGFGRRGFGGFIQYSNIVSFFRFVNKRSIYRLGIISLAHAPVHVTPIIIYFHLSQCRLIPYLHQRPIFFKANSIHSSINAILELIRGAQCLI